MAEETNSKRDPAPALAETPLRLAEPPKAELPEEEPKEAKAEEAPKEAAEAPKEAAEAPKEAKAAPPELLERPPDFKTAFRGYDRAATDAFLAKLGERMHSIVAERDLLRARVEEVERELDGHRGRLLAVAEALVTAQTLAAEVRASAEREVEESLREAAARRSAAEEEASELLRQARAEADRMIEDVQRGIREQQHEAEHILDDTKERLGSLVRDLLTRVPSRPASDG